MRPEYLARVGGIMAEENEDLFGTPKKLLENRIKELEVELKKEISKNKMFAKLYNRVNYMMGHLGANGEIDTRNKLSIDVMGILEDIDGGTFKEMEE